MFGNETNSERVKKTKGFQASTWQRALRDACCGMKGGVGVFGVSQSVSCVFVARRRLFSDQRPVCWSVYTELRYEQENPC